jgi:GT2 family glycosyltransferase
MNNDVVATEQNWLRDMCGHLLSPGVGVVGPKLIYPDGRIQHAGVILGLGGVAGHAFRLNHRDAFGYFGLQQVTHEVSAVTGACLLTRRAIYYEVGGFREDFPINFNDVAFCLDVLRKGYRVIYDADATLIHEESATRTARVDQAEIDHFLQLYSVHDPYYSPHFRRDTPVSYVL